LIDDFPEWRVIVHPKPLVLLKSRNDKKKIFLGARVHLTFEIKLLITATCQGKERMTAMLLRSQIPVVNVGRLTLQQTSEDVLQ
jgi:hypothetical protein